MLANVKFLEPIEHYTPGTITYNTPIPAFIFKQNPILNTSHYNITRNSGAKWRFIIPTIWLHGKKSMAALRVVDDRRSTTNHLPNELSLISIRRRRRQRPKRRRERGRRTRTGSGIDERKGRVGFYGSFRETERAPMMMMPPRPKRPHLLLLLL